MRTRYSMWFSLRGGERCAGVLKQDAGRAGLVLPVFLQLVGVDGRADAGDIADPDGAVHDF